MNAYTTAAIMYGISAAVNAITNLANKAKIAMSSTSNQPNLGRKLDYAFGKATGDSHSIIRSMANSVQLSKIGINDTLLGRRLLSAHFEKVFMANQELILNANENVAVYSLLAGPGGFRGVKSIWDGVDLITFIFYGV